MHYTMYSIRLNCQPKTEARKRSRRNLTTHRISFDEWYIAQKCDKRCLKEILILHIENFNNNVHKEFIAAERKLLLL